MKRFAAWSLVLFALAGMLALASANRRVGDCALMSVWYEQLRPETHAHDPRSVRIGDVSDSGLFELPVYSLAVRDPSADTATVHDFGLHPLNGTIYDAQSVNVTIAEWEAHREWDCQTWEQGT